MNMLHCILWAFSLSIGIHKEYLPLDTAIFSPHAYFTTSTNEMIIVSQSKIWFRLNSTRFWLLLSFVFHIWRFMPSIYGWALNFIWKSQKKESLPYVHMTWQVVCLQKELYTLLHRIQIVVEVQSLVWPATSGRIQHSPSCMSSEGAGSSSAISSKHSIRCPPYATELPSNLFLQESDPDIFADRR